MHQTSILSPKPQMLLTDKQLRRAGGRAAGQVDRHTILAAHACYLCCPWYAGLLQQKPRYGKFRVNGLPESCSVGAGRMAAGSAAAAAPCRRWLPRLHWRCTAHTFAGGLGCGLD